MNDFKKFLADIGKRKFSRIYLIHGNEEYFVSKAAELLIENAVQSSEREFNIDIFDGTEDTSEEVLSSSLSFPFIGERRLVVVRRFDKMDKKSRIDIANHLSELPATTVLCLVCGEIKMSDEPYKRISTAAATFALNRLGTADLSEYAIEVAKSFGKILDLDLVNLLIELTDGSVGDLVSEIEKLSIFTGDRKKITADDINASVGWSKSYNVFELQRAIGQRDIKRAQEIAHRMLDVGEKAIYINYMLAKYLVSLMQVKHLLKRGISSDEISKSVFGRWLPFINEYVSAGRKFSFEEIQDAIGVLLNADLKLKRGAYGDNEAVAIIISEILGQTA
jgi:DNA polymerase-3 subunit delta